MSISLSPFVPESLVSETRETGSTVSSRASLLILHTQTESGVHKGLSIMYISLPLVSASVLRFSCVLYVSVFENERLLGAFFLLWGRFFLPGFRLLKLVLSTEPPENIDRLIDRLID